MSDDVTDPPDDPEDPEDPDDGRTASADAAPYRPRYHYTPSNGWMNDPNGLVYDDGTYHLFYQAGHDRRRWDHATSTDLVNWTERGTKIPATSSIQAFSGGAVVDENDTSGFGTDAIVCMYTGHHDDGTEDQRIAYSTDGGDTVHEYSGNPVIADGHDDFRDPNPFWYEPTENWRMAIARVTDRSSRPAGIEIYESDDIVDWTYLGTYESGGAAWECPDLYRLPVINTTESRWVLGVSAGWDHCELHVGHFDGETFTADVVHHQDAGRDFYACQSWGNEPSSGDRLALAWMNNWEYAHETPDAGWKGALSFPRRIGLTDSGDGIELVQRPDSAIDDAHAETLATLSDESVDADTDPLADAGVAGKHLDVVATIYPGAADTVTLKIRKHGKEETRIKYDTANAELCFERGDAGEFFGPTSSLAAVSQPLSTRDDGTVKLRVLVDGSLVEVFANDGDGTMSNQIFPGETSRDTALTASGGTATLESLTAYSFETGLVDGQT